MVSPQRLIVTLLLISIVAHGKQTMVIPWSLTHVNSANPLDTIELHLGDVLLLECAEGFFSELVQQTETQFGKCDKNAVLPPGEEPIDDNLVVVDRCLGTARNLSIEIRNAADNNLGTRVFEAGQNYYFTSYSIDGANLTYGFRNLQSGGQCSEGLKLTLQVLAMSTTATTVDNSGSENGPSDGVTGGTGDIVNEGTTLAEEPTGPGGMVEPTSVLQPNIGGLGTGGEGGASGSKSKYLPIVTAVSVLLCVITSRLLW